MAQVQVSLLKQARELLRVTPKSNRTEVLAAATAGFQEAWDLIKVSCSHEHCIEFVSAATLLIIALDVVKAPVPPSPRGGAGDTNKTLERQAAVG